MKVGDIYKHKTEKNTYIVIAKTVRKAEWYVRRMTRNKFGNMVYDKLQIPNEAFLHESEINDNFTKE
jgi:hypothetical protein